MLANVANDVDVGLAQLALRRIIRPSETYIKVDRDVCIPLSCGRRGCR